MAFQGNTPIRPLKGAPNELSFLKWHTHTRDNKFNTNLCFTISNNHFKFSNIFSRLDSQLARFLHKMTLSEGVALVA